MYRKKLAMLFAEAFGTAVLTFVVLSVSQSPIGLPYFTSIAVGTTLGLMVLVIGSASGAHINPAVTLGFWSLRKIPTLQAVAYVAAQILGALSAWRLFEYLVNRTVENIAGRAFDWRVLVAEAAGAMVFTFAIAAAVYRDYKGLKLAVTVGTGLFLGIVIASAASNGVVNPAVAIGIRSLSRAYMIGPLVGALVGMNLYAWLFAPDNASLMPRRTVARSTAVEDRPSKASTPVTTTVTTKGKKRK